MKNKNSKIVPGTNKHNMMLVLRNDGKSATSSKKNVLKLEYFQLEQETITDLKSRIQRLEVAILQGIRCISNH